MGLGNLMNVDKSKYKVLHLDCNYQHELGDPRLEHSPAGKGLGGAGE